jgi:transcriptional regulator with XRE-family HTH domain
MAHPKYEVIADLRHRRLIVGLGQRQLAERAGVAELTVRRAEHGGRVRQPTSVAIRRALSAERATWQRWISTAAD